MSKSKELAEHEENAIQTMDEAALFANADNAADDFGQEDLTLPRLIALQSNSPQVAKRENTYVEGAEPGMIYDTVGSELWDGEKGIVILPIFFRHTYVEWILRENGGGFIADHGLHNGAELLKSCTKDDKNRDMLPSGNQLVNTLEYVVYYLNAEGYGQAILTMTSTQLRKGKTWNSNIRKPLPGGIPAPFYGRAFRFKTIPESNDKGQWFGWQITFECRMVELPDQGFPWCKIVEFNQACAAFRKKLVEGAVRVAPPISSEEAESDPEAL